MVGKVLWNVNGLDGIEHRPGRHAEAEGHTLGHQTRQITAQGARKVERRDRKQKHGFIRHCMITSSTNSGQCVSSVVVLFEVDPE